MDNIYYYPSLTAINEGDLQFLQFINNQQQQLYLSILSENHDAIELHGLLRAILNNDEAFPNILPPTTYKNEYNADSSLILAVDCDNLKPLRSYTVNQLFDRADFYNENGRGSKWQSKPMYPSMFFRKVVLSLIKTSFIFVSAESLEPIIDLSTMYVSKDGNIVFTRFRRRDPMIVDPGRALAQSIGDAITELFTQKKTGNPGNLAAEIADLCDWLLNSSPFVDPNPSKENLTDSLERPFFWDVNLRVEFIYKVAGYVLDGNSISIQSNDAFTVGINTNWHQTIINHNHPVLMTILQMGKKHYDLKKSSPNPPNYLRAPASTAGFTDADLLDSATIQYRDALCHAHDNRKPMAAARGGRRVRAINIQGYYQAIFPSHMVILANSQRLCMFNAREQLLQQFRESHIDYSLIEEEEEEEEEEDEDEEEDDI